MSRKKIQVLGCKASRITNFQLEFYTDLNIYPPWNDHPNKCNFNHLSKEDTPVCHKLNNRRYSYMKKYTLPMILDLYYKFARLN